MNTLSPHPCSRHRAKQVVEDLGMTTEQMADKLLALINRERLRNGLSELNRDKRLEDTANDHNLKMAGENNLDHQFPGYPSLGERLAEKGIFFSICAENVSSSETFLTRLIHQGLMESPPHRGNILSDRLTHCGIHVLLKGNLYYITQHFASIIIHHDSFSAERNVNEEIRRRISVLDRKQVSLISGTSEMLRKISTNRLNACVGNVELPDLGHSLYLHLTGPDLERIIPEITSEIQKKGYDTYGIGIAFKRNSFFPGGTFSVSVLFYPETDARPGRLESNKREIISYINQIRKSMFLPHLFTDKELNLIAAKLSSDPKNRNMNRLDLSGKRKILIASGERIEQIKGLLTRLAKANLNARRIGISVSIPEIDAIPVNYFVAVVII